MCINQKGIFVEVDVSNEPFSYFPASLNKFSMKESDVKLQQVFSNMYGEKKQVI